MFDEFLDLVPVVGEIKNLAEACQAFEDRDYRRGFSKVGEAALAGALDLETFGAGRVIETSIFKGAEKFIGEGTEGVPLHSAIAASLKMAGQNECSPFKDSRFQLRRSGESNNQSSSRQNRNTGNQSGKGQVQTDGYGDDRQPNDDDRNKPNFKRGDHVINNDILKLFRKLIEKFILMYTGASFSILENSHQITPSMQIYVDYHYQLPQTILDSIQTNMLVNTSGPSENDRVYGIIRHRLEVALTHYMQKIVDRISGRFNRDYIEQEEADARANVTYLVDEMISRGAFIDETAQRVWLMDDGYVDRRFRSNNERFRARSARHQELTSAREAVEEMLRSLVDRAEVWACDVYNAAHTPPH